MKIEMMIYVYIAICISMILYNIVYVFILRHREKALSENSKKFESLIADEISRIKTGKSVTKEHMSFLKKKLDRTAGITAFDRALEVIYKESPEVTEQYLLETYPVFEYLTKRYISKDTIKIAYFPYILDKYNILKFRESESLVPILFELLRSVNVYCRENTIKAIYSMQVPSLVAEALRIIDKNLSFHHPKLVCDGLMDYTGDRGALKDEFFEHYESYSDSMRVNILNFFRFGGVRCDEQMLRILQDENENNEVRYSAIRYFEKYPIEQARAVIQSYAENTEDRATEFQIVATSALKSYPDDVTFRILVKNLSNRNWYVRQNSAMSCQRLGYSYQDLINVFDGNDRYAREIMRYYLDKRNAEKETVKA